MLESWRPNPSWMDAVASVLLNLRGRQSGQGEKAHSVTALNHDTKLQIPVIHLSQEIQSVALLQPHVFIPRSRLDSGRGVLFWNMAIFVWDLNDTCGHFFFFFFLWFFFSQHLQKNSPRVKKHTWELNALGGGFTVLRNDEGGKKRLGQGELPLREERETTCVVSALRPFHTKLTWGLLTLNIFRFKSLSQRAHPNKNLVLNIRETLRKLLQGPDSRTKIHYNVNNNVIFIHP